jgi:predicted dehydrogenase
LRSKPYETPIRVALLGAGVIAGPHISALKSLPGLNVVAVCDLDAAKARAFQEEHGIPLAFADLTAMLGETSPDAVHVLLPPTAHARAAEQCLEAGSHVLVEKPFCVSVAECRRVEGVAERVGRRVGVNHNLTFMPSFLKLVEAIRSCRLGALEHVRVMYNLPAPGIATGPHTHWMFGGVGNVILEIGPHPISVICRLLGRAVSASTAVSGELTLTNGTPFFRTWQSSLVCERGAAQFVLSLGGGYQSTTVHVIGEDGEALADFRRNTIRLSENNRYLRAGDLVDGWTNASGLARQSFGNFLRYGLGTVGLRSPYQMQNVSVKNSLAAFYQALRSGCAPVIGGAEGTAVVEACELVINSARVFAAQIGVERVANR